MPSIDRPLGDLRTLTRETDSARPSGVPAPKFSWKTRVVLPGAILLVLLLLVAYSAQEALWPVRAVRVVSVVVFAMAGSLLAPPSAAATTSAAMGPLTRTGRARTGTAALRGDRRR